MGILVAGVVGIFLIMAVALLAMAKTLNAEKLFGMSLLSLIIFTGTLVGLSVLFLDLETQQVVEGDIDEEIDDNIEEPLEDTPDMNFTIAGINEETKSFPTFYEAVAAAKKQTPPSVVKYFDEIVWREMSEIPSRVLQVPLIFQFPELARGAEITSLAMMLNYAEVSVNKMELAEEITKDPTLLSITNGTVFFGNPYDGFVGDPYSFDRPGYGVYHGPIADLAEQYLPGKIIDMTGAALEDILYPLHLGQPVWVMVHTKFSPLPESSFQTWKTPSGEVDITFYKHSVLLTGYDDHFIYFNDPLSREVNRPISIERFEEAWLQMGQQAISYVK